MTPLCKLCHSQIIWKCFPQRWKTGYQGRNRTEIPFIHENSFYISLQCFVLQQSFFILTLGKKIQCYRIFFNKCITYQKSFLCKSALTVSQTFTYLKILLQVQFTTLEQDTHNLEMIKPPTRKKFFLNTCSTHKLLLIELEKEA